MNAKAPTCGRCGKDLTVYEVSYSHISGRLPTLYGGVVCSKCHRVECMSCKNGPAERPCSWCGFPVVPADEDEIAKLKKKGRKSKRREQASWSAGRWRKVVPAAVLLAVLVVFLLPAIKLYVPMFSVSSTPAAPTPPVNEFTEKQGTSPASKEVPRKIMPPAAGAGSVAPQAKSKPVGKAARTAVKLNERSPAPEAEMKDAGEDTAKPAVREPAPAVSDSLVGSRVRITTKDGRAMEGFVTEDSGGIIALTRAYSKGTFNMSFHVDEIRNIQLVPFPTGG